MALVTSGDAEFQVVWAAKRWTKRAGSILLCGQADLGYGIADTGSGLQLAGSAGCGSTPAGSTSMAVAISISYTSVCRRSCFSFISSISSPRSLAAICSNKQTCLVESCHMNLVCASRLPCESELAPWVQISSRSLTAIAVANRHA